MYFDETLKKIESSVQKLEELDRMLMTLKSIMDELMDSANQPASAEPESVTSSSPKDQI